MPDGLPVIGPSPRSPRVLYAFGHQHIGWTLGGITAQLISKLVAGQQPDLDLTPLRPNRFSIASLLR
jgi:D-amino-acid dehydrogenase